MQLDAEEARESQDTSPSPHARDSADQLSSALSGMTIAPRATAKETHGFSSTPSLLSSLFPSAAKPSPVGCVPSWLGIILTGHASPERLEQLHTALDFSFLPTT